MNKRIAHWSTAAVTALGVFAFGGSAMANGVAGPMLTSVSPAFGARGATVVVHGANLQHASVKWAIACDPGAQGSMPMKETPIRAVVSAHGTRITFAVPRAFGGLNRIAITTPTGAVSATFVVTTTPAL